ncbi:transglutaminase-like domain-containing protein [Olleya sp. HaHaR_3_96]|uniref:transglutaminase-like domain-containing protein n=1 Tax=Olleya sp. HaHaR_3_96 TaxID=2745560 RepID=UPI001C4FA365|nr:transglutaminase-like domain-containing protein [Olleya sp. HaHaR_3_96]QXP59199.1 hypothetical protein H0I26_14910 [Olleya sp. HaHaR_3_96]
MPKITVCLILTLFSFQFLLAQKKADPTTSEKLYAEQLKTQFPDDNIALDASDDVLSFSYDKNTDKVTVNHVLKETLINLDSRSDIQLYCVYDDQTEINTFNITYKTNKDAYFRIIDEAYTSQDLFHVDTRVKYTNIDFPLLGYKYHNTIDKTYLDVKYLTKLYFNDNYPIVKKTIKIEVPDWLDIELKEMNFDGYDIIKTTKSNSKRKSKTHTYSIENIKAMSKEENAPGPTYIYPHILILAKSYTIKNDKKVLFANTQDLYNWYKSLANELKNDNSLLKDKVIELTKNAKTDEDKIKNIYYWVQDNIRYIAFEDGIAGFKPDEASSVYTKRFGDCKGMANLTKQMLVEAGFDARLTWIGTKRIAYDYSIPSLSVDNHMICTLFKDGKTIFLDATEKYNPFGEYADRIQGKQVLIEDSDKYIIKTVPNSKASFNKEVFNYDLSLQGETIIGNVTKQYNGESRSGLLYYFNTIKNDKKDTFLEYFLNEGNNNITVSNINTNDLNDRESNIDISYNVKVNNAISSFDNTLYVDLDFDKEFLNYDFKERETDYIFSAKKHIESNTRLKIPSGYTVSELPKNISITNENYNLSVSFLKENDIIKYNKSFTITNAKIEKKDFPQWNDFISQLTNLYKEQIILTKQ